MGPFALMDFIGHDVNFRVTESVFSSFFFDQKYKPSFSQKRLFEAGFFGKKSGRGFYNYSLPLPVATTDEVLGKQIVDRIVAMLINEAAEAMLMNVATIKDIELAMTKGVNYPMGLLKWADEWGLNNVLSMLDSLYNDYHEDRYRASILLRRMSNEQKSFIN